MGDSKQPGRRLGIGSVIGGYRIEGQLGSGGMGVVYKATQLSLKRDVALKVLSQDLAFDRESRERFRQEGVLAARVRHPRLVDVLEVGEAEDRLFLAYELIHGGTLRQKISELGALPVETALEVATACADVLAVLHRAKILHRDLKPENIFMTPDRGPMIGDLGIAKDLLHSRVKTQQGFMLGTPLYMAPEMVQGADASPATDLYAAGIVLFECLAGKPPFVANDTPSVLRLHVKEAVPSICAARPGLGPEFDRLLGHALAKDPRARFPTAEALRAALESAAKKGPSDVTVLHATTPGGRVRSLRIQEPAQTVSASRRVPPPGSATASPPAWRAVALAAAGALLVSAGAAAGLWLQARRAASQPPAAQALQPEAPRPPDREALARQSYQRALQALRVNRQTSAAIYKSSARNPAVLRVDAVLEQGMTLYRKGVAQIEQTLPALAALASSGSVEAASFGGRLLVELFLLIDFARAQAWDNLTAMAQANDPSWALISLSLESVANTYYVGLSRDLIGLRGRLPPSLSSSSDIRWRAGMIGLRSLSRHALPKDGIARIGQELTTQVRDLIATVPIQPHPDLGTVLVLSVALRSLVYVAAFQGTQEISTRIAAALPEADRGAMTPGRELLLYEARSAHTRLILRTNIADADRLTKEASQLESWTALRNRLLEKWPYDLRGQKPSDAEGALAAALQLHDAACERLEEARQYLAVAARKQNARIPPEPTRKR